MKNEYEVINAKEAAKMLKVPVLMIREHLKRGKGIFACLGSAEKVGTNYRYIVIKGRVEKFIEENYNKK